MLSSIYLTGNTYNPTNPQHYGQPYMPDMSMDWRNFALTRLQYHGLRVVNPLELPWTETEVDFAEEAIDLANLGDERVRRALGMIDQCDGLLANLERPSFGTAMEIFYAHRTGKMVTVVRQGPYNPWVLSHSQARFNDIDLALQYIIGQQPYSDPVDWAIQYESILADRYEQMPPTGEPDFKIIGGDLPVLVLAPHATAFWREGEFHETESFTGSMAALLNRVTGCNVMHSNFCMAADPGWYLDTPFKQAMAEQIKSLNIGMVVMLMGATWQEAPGVQLSAYGLSNQLHSDRYHLYFSQLRNGLSQLEPISSKAFDQHIRPLADFVGDTLGLPVMVTRLHKRYRMPRLQGQQFSKATQAIAQFISDVGTHLEFHRKRGQ